MAKVTSFLDDAELLEIMSLIEELLLRGETSSQLLCGPGLAVESLEVVFMSWALVDVMREERTRGPDYNRFWK